MYFGFSVGCKVSIIGIIPFNIQSSVPLYSTGTIIQIDPYNTYPIKVFVNNIILSCFPSQLKLLTSMPII